MSKNNERLTKLLGMLEQKPSDSFLLFAIGKEYESMGKLDRTLKYYLQLQDADPEYIGLYYHLGKLYEKIQEEILALKTYKAGIELAKSTDDFHALSELNNAKMNLEILLGN